MTRKKTDIYILGTGLSHDGSACLLKNGKICVAIEKERITRVKHDGLNDTDAINYCLDAEGITLSDVDLVVQNSNFDNFEFGNEYFAGKRIFATAPNVKVVTISHHLAHAYYAVGTAPFDETAVLVIDGCGSSFDDCVDLKNSKLTPETISDDLKHLYFEKDSFYVYKNGRMETIYKDFSPFGLSLKGYPMYPNTTKHSIGGLYLGATGYCFKGDSDPGKLMGLAPYGKAGVYSDEIFELKDGRVFVNYNWMRKFNSQVRVESEFWNNFQYYADIAKWVQSETERAISYVVENRRKLTDCENLSFTGGVALNAVANGKLVEQGHFTNHYFTPAASDNGLAIGCAYYGWLEVMKKSKVKADDRCTYGKTYSQQSIHRDIEKFFVRDEKSSDIYIRNFFENILKYIDVDEIDDRKYAIRFQISGEPAFDIILQDKAEMIENRVGRVDCMLTTDRVTFMNAISDRSYLFDAIRQNKASLTGDIGYFLKVIRLDDLISKMNDLMLGHVEVKKPIYTRHKNIAARTAELLANGRVVGWFQGGCEFGPRALGHRSILADPRKVGIRKFINNKIKFREDFRPFAPSVLKEDASHYFEFTGDSPYMILVVKVKPGVENLVPGVVHVDKTARIQTVTRETDEGYHDLLKEFKDLTGIPMLLNTSFNKRGMPIVETPIQALNYFYECALDCLVIGDVIVYKHESLENRESEFELVSESELLDD